MADESGVEVDGATLRALAAWLADCIGSPVESTGLRVRAPSAGGWSNDTWMVDTGDAGRARVVVRLQPERASMFPRYDLGRQVACLAALRAEPAVPTPDLLAVDLEGGRLGRPAFVMAHVAGRVPSDDRPSFVEAGWLADAAPAEQRRFHCGLIDAVSAVHGVDLDRSGLGQLRPPGVAAGGSNLAALDDLETLWHWDRGPLAPGGIDEAFAVVRAEAPAPASDCLLWGDARPANVVVAPDGYEPVALLDWELAAVGSPEHDLTWLMEMNWMRAEGAGLAPLAGFLPDDEAAARYEATSGRRLAALGWYRTVAALKVAVLMHRYLRAMVHAGRLPADHKVLSDTVASRRLASLLAAR